MDYFDLKRINDLSSDAIKAVRQLLDYVETRDVNLYRHVYKCWDKLCNVQFAANNKLNSRPVCPDRSNCPGWIQGHGCDFCSFKPF